MGRLRRFTRLSSGERRLLIQTALLLGAIRLGLWLLPFRTLRGSLAGSSRVFIRSRDEERPSKEMVIWAVQTAGRYVSPASTCLTEALAAQFLLARRGYPALLRIGVARSDGPRLEAHAWIESEGQVVIGGRQLARYTPLTGLEIGGLYEGAEH